MVRTYQETKQKITLYKGDDVLATRVPPRTPGHLRRKIVKIKQGLKRGRCSSIQLRLHVEHLECGR